MSNYIKTEVGSLMWVSTIKAKTNQYGNTNYEASHVVSEGAAKAFNAQFEASLKEFLDAKSAEFGQQFVSALKIKYPYYEEVDEEKNKTGMWVAKATAVSTYKTKKGVDIDNRPQVVDIEKNPITVEVGNGSEGVLVVEARPWFLTLEKKTVSMPLRLKAIQVTKLVPYEGKTNPLDVL